MSLDQDHTGGHHPVEEEDDHQYEGLVLNPNWLGSIQEGAYSMFVNNTQRTTIASFPDGGREGLRNVKI
jgi:hypothetical protein